MSASPHIAVDFGTSNTVAMLAGSDDSVRPLLYDASPLLASGVLGAPGPALLTGADAARAAVAAPAAYEPNPKRRIDDGVVWLGEREYRVIDLIGAVLGRVVQEATRVCGRPPARSVLTHPATWARTRLELLVAAAARAQLPGVTLIAEPVAAAAYFAAVLHGDLPVGRCLVVYDLGGGTFDVSVVRRTGDGGYELAASGGLGDVGGLDLDGVVVEWARSHTAEASAAWGAIDWPQTAEDRRARRALWDGARQAKEQLSRHSAADLHVPLVRADLHLTRDEFEAAARPLLERTAAATLSTVREARVAREAVAGVLLVGGSSRVPLVATVLHRALGIAPAAIDQPELVVAEGALRASGLLGGEPTPAAAPRPAAPPPSAPSIRLAPLAAADPLASPVPFAPQAGPVPQAPPGWRSGPTAPRPNLDAVRLSPIEIILPNVSGVTLRHVAATLTPDGGWSELPVFLAERGRLQLFEDEEELLRFVRGGASHDLVRMPNWPKIAAGLSVADLTPQDEDRYELDLVGGALAHGPIVADPGVMISAGEIARDLAQGLGLVDLQRVLAPGTDLDNLDEAFRTEGGRGRRWLKRFRAERIAEGWRAVIARIEAVVDHHPR